MAENKKPSLKERLALERKKREEADKVKLAPKKSLKSAKKNLSAISEQVENIHQTVAPKPKAKKSTPPPALVKEVKERFTLWLPESVHQAFKIHVATRKGSGSDYLEMLIRKDLKLK